MNYTTQMDAARKGILTKELLAVAQKRADGTRKAGQTGCCRTGRDPGK